MATTANFCTPYAVALGDIPSADVVIPDKCSITIVGRKVHAGVLVLLAIVISCYFHTI